MRQADRDFTVRTDLAIEERERVSEGSKEIPGIRVREWEKEESGIRVTEVNICDERGEEALGKPRGYYLTLEAPALAKKDGDYHREVSEELSERLKDLLELHGLKEERLKRPVRILAVGLGNAKATPDALGPRVLENLKVTRHFAMEYGMGFCEENGYPVLSGITPGVMAQTGMETAEIVSGIVEETEPDAVLVIDALAAGSAKRVGTTIQLSDTGIQPGSGVGNHRNGLTEETLGVPVFAIGIPMVVGAASIVRDTAAAMMEIMKGRKGREETEKSETEKSKKQDLCKDGRESEIREKNKYRKKSEVVGEKETRSGVEYKGESESGGEKEEGRARIENECREKNKDEWENDENIMDMDEIMENLRERLRPDLAPMYVTPHDIDERVEYLSYTISEGVHRALFGEE